MIMHNYTWHDSCKSLFKLSDNSGYSDNSEYSDNSRKKFELSEYSENSARKGRARAAKALPQLSEYLK